MPILVKLKCPICYKKKTVISFSLKSDGKLEISRMYDYGTASDSTIRVFVGSVLTVGDAVSG